MITGFKIEQKIHFVGIGGIGMSGLAQVLLDQGFKVSGSDLGDSPILTLLESKGAKIFKGHEASNVEDAQVVVRSSAISFNNPEVKWAIENKIPVIKRAEVLAELMRNKVGIAVAGSHGKTTTTSILASIAKELELNATAVVGGIVKNIGSNAFWGNGKYVIAEADESDGSFLCLNPICSVLTNIDNDHLDFYGTKEKVEQAFESFITQIPFYGIVVVNGHDKNLCDIALKGNKKYLTYGFKSKQSFCEVLDYEVQEKSTDTTHTVFVVKNEYEEAEFKMQLAGEHNILNATGAIALINQLGFALEEISKAVGSFAGIKRRFEVVYNDENLVIVDDYGHHPTEIQATIQTALKRYKDKDVSVLFEPHRFSRTERLWTEFTECFTGVESVYIAPIYPASEKEIKNITSERLANEIQGAKATYLADWNLKKLIEQHKDNNKVLLCLGAGKISRLLKEAIDELTV